VEACTTVTAVRGSATIVIALPRLLIVEPVQKRQNTLLPCLTPASSAIDE
jgi:hypothetical protein